MAQANSPPARLITIPVSHYCEKTRWALTRLHIPFVEERHMPPFHRFATRGLVPRSGAIPETERNLSPLNRTVVKLVGGQSVPVLVTSTAILSSSDEILQYLDAIAPPALQLYPNHPEQQQQRQQIQQLVDLFDHQLGPAVRLWTYAHIMSLSHIVQPLWCQGVPWFERQLFPLTFAWMRSNVIEMYGINPASAHAAQQTILQMFELVERLLADGRRYLLGDRFSAADLTFATLAAVLVLPPQYGIQLPALSALPPEMARQMQQLQTTPAGQFVLQLYQEHAQVIQSPRDSIPQGFNASVIDSMPQ